MDAKQAIEHYKANKTFYMDNQGMRELAELIERQEQSITDLQIRLRELDEKNQTQAHCLAARAEKIDRLEAEVRRLNRMVDAAVYCLTEVPCGHCVFEEWCSPSPGGPSCEQILRKHLESEADNNG